MSSTKWFQFGEDPHFDEAARAFDAKDFETASEHFRAAFENSKNPTIRADSREGLIRSLQMIFEIAFRAESFDRALAAVGEALSLAQSYPDLWFRKGLALAQLGKGGEAQKSWKRALQLNPDFDSAKKAMALFSGGNAAGDDVLGVLGRNMLTALASTVTSAVEDVVRADELLRDGKFDEAIGVCESVLIRNPNFADVRCKLGIALAESGQLEAALVQLGHALAINPRYADAHAQRGIVLKRLKRAKDAREAFRQALMCNPNHPIAAHEIG